MTIDTEVLQEAINKYAGEINRIVALSSYGDYTWKGVLAEFMMEVINGSEE